MKNLFITFLFLGLIACSTDGNRGETAEETETQETGQDEEQVSEDTASQTTVVSDQDIEKFKTISADVADQIVEAYLQIKEALVTTNGSEAKQAAASIQEDLQNKEGEAVELIREDIEHIANTESVEHQREHFNALSRHIYALVKANDVKGTTLYRQYCPMAFDNTGAFWLSSSKEIKNPYFGNKMLKCGRVEETIQ